MGSLSLPAAGAGETGGPAPNKKTCQISDKAADEIVPQHKQPESGRYLIQVDKQTKASYDTAEAAQSAALEIKKGYPIVKVSIFDSIESTSHLIELPLMS
jgi:hypothetical protein